MEARGAGRRPALRDPLYSALRNRVMPTFDDEGMTLFLSAEYTSIRGLTVSCSMPTSPVSSCVSSPCVST